MLDVKEYVKQYEREHPAASANAIPQDPSKRWFGIAGCEDKCKFALFEEALSQAEMRSPAEPMSDTQRLIHARYASLQSRCTFACEGRN